MEDILEFFEELMESITSVVDLVVGFFEDIVYIVQITGEVLASIPSYFAWLPGEVVALLLTLFAIVVVYKVSGREG